MRTPPPEVERSTPHFTVSVSLQCPQWTVLPTLSPRVLQGAAVFGERISQDPPGNILALGCPPPRRVSERSVQTLPIGLPFQDVILTAQLDRAWLMLPHLRMETLEARSVATRCCHSHERQICGLTQFANCVRSTLIVISLQFSLVGLQQIHCV